MSEAEMIDPNGAKENEEPRTVAVIVAHPDDAEFMCAGTVATWTAAGREVSYVVITSGDKGSDDPTMTSEQLVETREAEQRAACEILGVNEVVFLRFPDAMLAPDLRLRRELTRVIRRLRPDAVMCQDPTMRWADSSYINHPDHRAAGDAALDAVFPAARDRLTFPELLGEGLEPHKVRFVYLMGTATPDYWVDISAGLETKLAALRAHASQIGDWNPEEMVRDWAKQTAQEHPGHGDYAEAFKRFVLD